MLAYIFSTVITTWNTNGGIYAAGVQIFVQLSVHREGCPLIGSIGGPVIYSWFDWHNNSQRTRRFCTYIVVPCFFSTENVVVATKVSVGHHAGLGTGFPERRVKSWLVPERLSTKFCSWFEVLGFFLTGWLVFLRLRWCYLRMYYFPFSRLSG